MNNQEIINFYIENNILISPELIDYLEKPLPIKTDFSVINKEVLLIIEHKIPINVSDYELSLVLKEKNINKKIYEKFKEYIFNNLNKNELEKKAAEQKKEYEKKEFEITLENKLSENFKEDELYEYKKEFIKKNRIKIIEDYKEKSRKRTVSDFIGFFNSRFKVLEKILRSREELKNPTSISRILTKKEKDNVSIIGMVYDKNISKNKNIILTLEDQTGFIKVVVSQSKEELYRLAEEIQLDEVIGVTGIYDGFVFAKDLFLPDIPLINELKKSPEEGYFVVITDPQVGNKLFLEEDFKRFLQWLKGESGNEIQKTIASKVKYLFIVGDLVEGVGVYPDQEYDLNIIDVRDQYKKLAEYLKDIKIPIIVCPGNHDVGRLSEPQPGLRDEYSKELWKLPNVICVSNPSIVNIFSSETFEGFNVLLYHGGSFFYYFNNVPEIRKAGGPTRSDLVMNYLLKRRHLAPSHTSTIYIPDPQKDPLLIEKIPDFFFSGHVHRATVNNYKNITCINASCWVAKTEEQERRGLDPQPGRAFVVNMQTREVKVINFLKEKKEEND
ncbi:MAG: metallophosphoesterase [Candidatus Woesearchaeota archaeon]